ncbi:FtsQ-type POTRA domain-containing protein [Pelagibacteraceae bacterium]|nr:FtsQ-type POTRA domain-containing protein [Pelagibacteraceae bacterium]
MKKRLVIALALLVLFSTYKPQKLILSSKFNIEEIKIENNFVLNDKEIKKDLAFLYNKNLIFLKISNVAKILKKNNFIDSFEIKKIYPNKLKIKIYEKKPIAILQNKDKKFYISENVNLINFIDLKNYKDLPTIFGNKESFEILFKNLKEIDFPFDLIKRYYLYESKRWDLETYKKRLIKLPAENYTKSLKNFMNLRKENNFNKYEVFDYRINNQLILK